MLRIVRNCAVVLAAVTFTVTPAAASHDGCLMQGDFSAMIVAGEDVCDGESGSYCFTGDCMAWTCDDIEEGVGISC